MKKKTIKFPYYVRLAKITSKRSMSKKQIQEQRKECEQSSKIIEAGYSEIREAFKKEKSSQATQRDTARKYYI